MATIKHIASKNADYGAAEQYLTFAHDEFTMRPVLDENGRLVPRRDYRIAALNCGGEDFAIACMRANLRYGKNQQKEDIKSHHYIISFDPRDGPDHGLTVDRAQELGERFCREHFPGHQALVCTHPDGHDHTGNIHVHIVINSLRVQEVQREAYMDRQCDTQAGAKHRCTAAAMRYFRAEVMEMCHREGLYQIDLLGGSRTRVSDREYWARRKGQLALDREASAQGKPPTKFETDKDRLRREIRAVLADAVSFEDFAQRLLQRGITVRESRGRLSYLTPERTKPITARRLGDDFDRTAVGAVLEQNAARPRRETPARKPDPIGQPHRSQGIQKMVDIEAKRAEGKGKGYERWASTFNLKQAAKAVAIYQEYGFSSPDDLDAAILAAYEGLQDSQDRLKPIEAALREKRVLRRRSGAQITHELRPSLCNIRELSEFFRINNAVIRVVRLGELGEFAVCPVEIAAVNDNAAQRYRVTVHVLRRRVDNYIRAELERAAKHGSCERVINDKRNIIVVRQLREFLDIENRQSGICDRFAQNCLRVGLYRL